MKNIVIGMLSLIIIIIWTFFICKSINNKDLIKKIILLSFLLIFLIIIRTIKYSINNRQIIECYLWYIYYIPILFTSNIFFSICTWNKRKNKFIKKFKMISFIISLLLFLFIITNNIHLLAFKIDLTKPNIGSNYTYGIIYYLLLIYIFIILIISIIYAVKGSKGFFKKQKVIILFIIIIMVFLYAINYIIKVSFIKIFREFTIIYSFAYLLSLFIVVFKEKYRLTLEDNLYQEIEESIKNKAILINKYLNNISESKNKKRDLAYIKLLVSYCKGKSNLIVIKNNEDSYSSKNLKMLLDNALKDVMCLNINGAVNIRNNFDISISLIFIIYDYIYNILENLFKYQCSDILINIDKKNNFINLKILITSKNKIKPLEYNYEINNYINILKENQEIDDNVLNINLEIPLTYENIKLNNLTEKEINAILHIKTKVHDILGQRLSLLSSIIDNHNYKKIDEIRPLLNNILDDLNNDNYVDPNQMLMNLVNTCKLVGTNLYIVGNLPKNYIKSIAVVKIIRECSTNAIRHAKAKNIYVEIIKKEKTEIIISNDGKIPKTIKEGDGIKGLKLRVKELNGDIKISTTDKFIITILL